MLQQLGKFASSQRLRSLIGVLLGCGLITAIFLNTISQGENKNYLPIVQKEGESLPITPTPPCPAHFVNPPTAGQTSPPVTGHVNTIVSIVNQTTGETMGTDVIVAAGGYHCPGVADFAPPYQLSQPLVEGQILYVHGNDDSLDTAVVTVTIQAYRQSAHLTQNLTATPSPPDLLILNPPQLISTPPIEAYQLVQFTVEITNAGDIDINNQFFIDLYLDPQPPIVMTTTIPITESDGYTAVSALAGGTSQIVTITSQIGFTNEPISHNVYAMVDSLEQVSESDETNNVSPPAIIDFVTPVATPTEPPSSPDQTISGIAYLFTDRFNPQYRAAIRVYEAATDNVVAITQTDVNGTYEIDQLIDSQLYDIDACITLDGVEYYGYRTAVAAPHDLVYINLQPRPCAAEPPVTPTPTNPYIVLQPTCSSPTTDPGDVSVNVTFVNWPTDFSLLLLWDSVPELVWQADQHSGTFTIPMTKNLSQESQTYPVSAQSGAGHMDTEIFTVPCPLP